MIVIVDDDRLALMFVKKTLETEGFPVTDFDCAADALAYLADHQVWLIISDIRMPQMDGFAFQTAFQQQCPNSDTPFIFLSSLGDGRSIIHGLDLGADDYLIKPVEPLLLQAKVRSILRRRAREKVAIFHGDFKKISFINLLKFCESNGLTGKIQIEQSHQVHHVPFNAGNIMFTESLERDDTLSQLYDLSEGTFRIYSHSVSFKEIGNAAACTEDHQDATTSMLLPTGILSSILVEGHHYQAQTEYTHPQGCSPRIVTIITRGGETLLKRVSTPELGQEKVQLEQTITEQHHRVELEFRELRLSRNLDENPTISPPEKVSLLFDEGYDKYRQGDYPGALLAFEEAKRLDPENRTLEVNLKVIRKKLTQAKTL